MIFKSLPAGKGDSFILSWGKGGSTAYIVVDGGIPGTFQYLRREYSQRGLPIAVIVTHVDNDHIGGVGSFFRDETIPYKSNVDVYVNTPNLILFPGDDDKVKIEHGIRFSEKLKELGIVPKGLYSGINSGEPLHVGELELIPLSPDKKVLQSFIDAWAKLSTQQLKAEQDKLLALEEGTDKVGRRGASLENYYDIINSGDSVPKWEIDLLNASSMAFIAIHGDQSVLFLGDANPDIVAAELETISKSTTDKLKVNLVKLSHHGCKHNTTKRLLSLIECDTFYLSTNGSGSSYHPDRETIVKISEYSRRDKSKPIRIYTNYELDKTTFVSAAEEKEWNILVEYKDVIDIDDLVEVQKKSNKSNS